MRYDEKIANYIKLQKSRMAVSGKPRKRKKQIAQSTRKNGQQIAPSVL